MWIFSERGFFSAVEKWSDRDTGMVTVRARCKADLDRLGDLIDAKPFRAEYTTDYPWRIKCTKEQWAAALYEMAMEIDYSNFKDRVKHTLGPRRANIYHRIWAVLLDLESRRSKKRRWHSYESHWNHGDEDALCVCGHRRADHWRIAPTGCRDQACACVSFEAVEEVAA